MEMPVAIPCGELRLEGLFTPGDPHWAGIVLHPHPLYGGTMHNNVVEAATAALKQAGAGALRFNFRGVGRSTGSYGEGLAEQDDVVSAAEYLRERGIATVTVIGYSFGAWVAIHAWPRLAPLGVRPPVLVAPPAAAMPFDDLPADARAGLIVCGRSDTIAPPGLAEALGRRLDPPLAPVILDGTDHFFGGQEPALTEILAEYLTSTQADS